MGLKNAPSELQHIRNDILNPHSDFTIVYIDDVLIFSQSLKRHFKHLNIFKETIKRNGMVISAKNIKLFQTKIRFLGHEIHQRIWKTTKGKEVISVIPPLEEITFPNIDNIEITTSLDYLLSFFPLSLP